MSTVTQPKHKRQPAKSRPPAAAVSAADAPKPRVAFRVSDDTGALPGESFSNAMRRHVAYIFLALEQLRNGEDFEVVDREIGGSTRALLCLSLEVAELEYADEANRKAVAA